MTSTPAPVTLDRAIGRWSLAALTLNCVVGAGILGLPGRVFALAGGLTGWVLAAAALLSIAVTLCLAELAGRFEAPGGPVEYCRAAFGEAAGFAAGWLSWTATVLAAGSLLNLFADLVAPGARLAVTIVTGCALTVFTMTGAGRSATGSAALTVVKLVLLAAVALAGLALPAAPAAVPSGAMHPATALVLLFFAFVGFERPTAVAGEVVSAQRTLPVALVGGMLGVTLLYAALFAACLRGVPGLATSTNPIQDLATRALGPTGGTITTVGAALIVLGTLASQWITAPRLLLALARDSTLPAPLAALSRRRRTPDMAIVATGATAMLLALNGSFVGGLAASSASRLLIFLACAGAVLRLDGRDGPPSRFHLPGRTMIAVAVVVACAALLVSAVAELVHLAMILCVGGILWLSTILTRRSA